LVAQKTMKRPPPRSDTNRVSELPLEDRPDSIWIGPVDPIPVHYEDDPRFEDERAAWSSARKKAQALHTADELLDGVTDSDWRVRFESVDRLAARWHDDSRTLPALLELAEHDLVWQVRGSRNDEASRFRPRYGCACRASRAGRSEC
jgi:hypothetical protein